VRLSNNATNVGIEGNAFLGQGGADDYALENWTCEGKASTFTAVKRNLFVEPGASYVELQGPACPGSLAVAPNPSQLTGFANLNAAENVGVIHSGCSPALGCPALAAACATVADCQHDVFPTLDYADPTSFSLAGTLPCSIVQLDPALPPDDLVDVRANTRVAPFSPGAFESDACK
jgi:hypothetical protein